MKRGNSILGFYCGNEEVYNQSYFKKFSQDTPRGYGIEVSIPIEKIDEFYQKVKEKLGEECIVKPLEEKRWGNRDFRLIDPFGFYLRFYEPVDILVKPKI